MYHRERPAGHSLLSQQAVSHSKILYDSNWCTLHHISGD